MLGKDRDMLLLFMYLDSLLVDDREMLLSAHPWTLCWWRAGGWSSLFVPGLPASGGQGNASLCIYLNSAGGLQGDGF